MSNIIHPNNNLVNSSRFLSPKPNKTKSKSLKLVFMGTPEFAVPVLEKLANSEYKPIAVFCAPDKPVGRKQILTPPPTKMIAQKYNISAWQPANSHELADIIKSVHCNIIISAAYGLILPKEVLDTPRYNCLNIHPSLLPKYRGASPIQSAILNGDTETGITIYKMDKQIDHGPIIVQKTYSINKAGDRVEKSKIATPELSEKLSNLGAELLLETLPEWLAGKITPAPQNDSLASQTKIIKKEDGQINWHKSAKEIEQKIRAYTPWPGAHTRIMNQELGTMDLKIISADVQEGGSNQQPGKIFLDKDDRLLTQTGQGYLVIKNLQLEGGKPLDASDFLRGHKNVIGKILN